MLTFSEESRSDVGLPESLQRSMAIEAHADREAEAKALEAEGENQASKILVDAATTITSTPAGLAVRCMVQESSKYEKAPKNNNGYDHFAHKFLVHKNLVKPEYSKSSHD